MKNLQKPPYPKNLENGSAALMLLMVLVLLTIGGGVYMYKNTSTSNIVNEEMPRSEQTRETTVPNTSIEKQQKPASINNGNIYEKTFTECMKIGQQICYESELLRTLIVRKQAPRVLNSEGIKNQADVNVEIFKNGVKLPFSTITDRTLIETRGHGIVLEFESNQDAKKYFDSSFLIPASNRTIMLISDNMVKETRSGVSESNLIFYVNKFIISFEGISPSTENHFIKIAKDISR